MSMILDRDRKRPRNKNARMSKRQGERNVVVNDIHQKCFG